MAKQPRSWGAGFRTARLSLPAELAQPIATTGDGRDITRPWVGELEEARDPRLLQSADWGVYDRVLLDDQVKSCLEQRRRAVVSRDWDVLPGDDNDPKAVEAGNRFKAMVERIGWDRVTDKMLYAPFHGYAVAELMWEVRDGQIGWSNIRVRHARRFRFDKDGALRLLTLTARTGVTMPARKFWVVTSGGADDDTPYGRGLAEWLYWPTLFKRNGIRFWNIFLDKFSVPTAKGSYPRGSGKDDIAKLLQAVQSIATDSGIVVPEGMAIELLTLAQSGADFEKIARYMDGAIAKVILSQTMTTDDGASRAQGQVHADVKLEVIKADADLLSDSFNDGPARWWTDLNYGPNVASPRLVRIVEEEDDLRAAAETDESLSRLGWRRTDDSFRDRFGDGYERTAERHEGREETPRPHAGADDALGTGNADNVVQLPRAIANLAATDPKPLYVYRRLKNTGDLIAWAKEQGFGSMVPASELHVTIAYSKRPVNWFDMAADFGPDELVVAEGGPRLVDKLGSQGAVVLHFASGDLTWRNRAMRDAGASWDYPDYHPHVTLTYAGDSVDLSRVEPYRGKLVFGPELFEGLDDAWSNQLQEVSLAEAGGARDVVDDAVGAAMADEGWARAFTDVLDPLVQQLQNARSPEEAAAVLAREAELADLGPFTERLARAGFALRLDALTDDGSEG